MNGFIFLFLKDEEMFSTFIMTVLVILQSVFGQGNELVSSVALISGLVFLVFVFLKIRKHRSLRIAMFVTKFPAISETFVINQIVGLIERGHKVDIYPLGLDKGEFNKIHPDVIKYRLLNHIRYIPAEVFRLNNGKRILQDPHMLSSACGEEPYDIMHCQFGDLGLIVLLFLKQPVFSKAKLICSFRGFDASSFVKTHGKEIYEELFQRADYLLPNSEYLKKKLIDWGCDQKKIKVHRSGIDCHQFFFQERSLRSDKKYLFVMIGRLIEKKGMRFGIDAMHNLVKSGMNIRMHIVGDGPLQEELDKQIRELQLTDRVKLVGLKDQMEVIELLEKAHFLLAPSITAHDGNQESIVNTAKEAMSMGLIVIASDHAGNSELIKDNINGFLVPEGDVKAIEEKINYLVNQPHNWPSVSKAARETIEQEYNIKKLNDELVKIYQKISNK